jgi:diguanylate cyclase
MDPATALLMAASLLVGAGLLWLAAATVAAASARPPAMASALGLVAVVQAACGLWWPAHAMRATVSSAALWSCVPALVLAALACGVGVLWKRGLRPWAAVAAVAMPAAAYVHAMVNAPGVFRLAQAPGWLGAGTLTLGLSVALIAAQVAAGDARRARAVRASASLAAAALSCLGAALSVTAADLARASIGPEWLVAGSLIGISAVMLAVLREAGAVLDRPTRPARAAALDPLTGLPTRLNFEGQLERAAKACDTKASRLAVLFIDLDGFKPVNDRFGHRSGDRVLEQVGQRLKALARNDGMAARIGGDEFLLLALDVASKDAVAQLATRLIKALSQPYRLDGRKVVIACSVGIALYPDKCQPNKLIGRADAAALSAKRAGGARHDFYAPEMDADVQQDFDMLHDLRQALVKGQLELHFQPKTDARSGKYTAAEALLRWNHPTRGVVMPGQFLPLAERSGLIGPLGNWVIEAACRQARAWRDKGLRMRVAINLSALQMRQDDIADRIAEALARYRIDASLLTCEITETAAMEDTAATQETFRRLADLGAHVSIDDFGTGYSSLAYLRRLPAEELKIDRSFVMDLDHSPDARAIVDAVVKLAHALGLKVVAEGVETVRQREILKELGCDELQGYLLARPMTASALLVLAMDDRSAAARFRDSLFGESRQAVRSGVAPDGR